MRHRWAAPERKGQIRCPTTSLSPPASGVLFSMRQQCTKNSQMLKGLGSTGNVLAAICSVFIPGLGQLVQGRVGMALVHFVLAGILWYFLLGWIIHLWSII